MPLTEAAAQTKLAAQRASQTGFDIGRRILANPNIHISSIESLVSANTAGMTAEQIDSFIQGLRSAASSNQNRLIPDFRDNE